MVIMASGIARGRVRTTTAVEWRNQEGGVNLLAQLWECAADDLSHYDVTSEPIREISMAAKR